jgi:hypothetical protein
MAVHMQSRVLQYVAVCVSVRSAAARILKRDYVCPLSLESI